MRKGLKLNVAFWKRKKKSSKKEEENIILPEQIEVTDVLDLHGFFPEEVPEIVDSFIENAIGLNLQEVKIIHGKGKSKLKWVVLKMLDAHSAVIDYFDAPPERGGWGATIVKLKLLQREAVTFSRNRIRSPKNGKQIEASLSSTLNSKKSDKNTN